MVFMASVLVMMMEELVDLGLDLPEEWSDAPMSLH
jgi:hypothetical protein